MTGGNHSAADSVMDDKDLKNNNNNNFQHNTTVARRSRAVVMECRGVSTKIQLAIYLVVTLEEEVFPTRN
jgi:hypothetical protein